MEASFGGVRNAITVRVELRDLDMMDKLRIVEEILRELAHSDLQVPEKRLAEFKVYLQATLEFLG